MTSLAQIFGRVCPHPNGFVLEPLLLLKTVEMTSCVPQMFLSISFSTIYAVDMFPSNSTSNYRVLFKKMSMALHVLPVVVAKLILLSHLGIPYHFNRCVLLFWWGGENKRGRATKGKPGPSCLSFQTYLDVPRS